MEKALSNILSNAVGYARPFGKVRVYFSGGNGLGLSITAKILEALSLRYSFEPFENPEEAGDCGMRFTVFL